MSVRGDKFLGAILVILVVCLLHYVSGQYGYGIQQHQQYSKGNQYHRGHNMHQDYGNMDQSAEEEQEEEKPRINFGIRLRVPAMKLELPRFNLPKITVTAKIRQPDGPRVIRLPAINLDTSSRLEPNGAEAQMQMQQQQHQQHQQQNHQSTDYQTGFDDEHEYKMSQQQHHYRHPNSPASRARQQANYNYRPSATTTNYGSYQQQTAGYRTTPQQHSSNRYYRQ